MKYSQSILYKTEKFNPKVCYVKKEKKNKQSTNLLL